MTTTRTKAARREQMRSALTDDRLALVRTQLAAWSERYPRYAVFRPSYQQIFELFQSESPATIEERGARFDIDQELANEELAARGTLRKAAG
jgi:hypothetical protein